MHKYCTQDLKNCSSISPCRKILLQLSPALFSKWSQPLFSNMAVSQRNPLPLPPIQYEERLWQPIEWKGYYPGWQNTVCTGCRLNMNHTLGKEFTSLICKVIWKVVNIFENRGNRYRWLGCLNNGKTHQVATTSHFSCFMTGRYGHKCGWNLEEDWWWIDSIILTTLAEINITRSVQ